MQKKNSCHKGLKETTNLIDKNSLHDDTDKSHKIPHTDSVMNVYFFQADFILIFKFSIFILAAYLIRDSQKFLCKSIDVSINIYSIN